MNKMREYEMRYKEYEDSCKRSAKWAINEIIGLLEKTTSRSYHDANGGVYFSEKDNCWMYCDYSLDSSYPYKLDNCIDVDLLFKFLREMYMVPFADIIKNSISTPKSKEDKQNG